MEWLVQRLFVISVDGKLDAQDTLAHDFLEHVELVEHHHKCAERNGGEDGEQVEPCANRHPYCHRHEDEPDVPRLLHCVAEPDYGKRAHQGKGLGDEFLRHIERTNLLVHLIDIGSENPYNNYKGINKELKLYAKGIISGKPQIIAVNKMDLPEAEKGLAALKKQLNDSVIPISAKTGQGIKVLIETICARLKI